MCTQTQTFSQWRETGYRLRPDARAVRVSKALGVLTAYYCRCAVYRPSEPTPPAAIECDWEIDSLTEAIKLDPCAELAQRVLGLAHYRKTGALAYLSLHQCRELGYSPSPAVIELGPADATGHRAQVVRWEYCLDQWASELGYPESESLREALGHNIQMRQELHHLRRQRRAA